MSKTIALQDERLDEECLLEHTAEMPAYITIKNPNAPESVLPPLPAATTKLLTPLELDYIENFLSNLPTRLTHWSGNKSKLDDREKRTRHIESEHKRRNKIKDELMRMTALVPTAQGTRVRNSQAKLLAQANDYIEELRQENQQLKAIINFRGL